MPYSGNYYSNLERFTVRGTSTVLDNSNPSAIFVSIFGVPNEFALERLRIMEASNLTVVPAEAIDIQILSNPALWRELESATPGSGEPYVIVGMEDVVSESGPNTAWLYDDIYDPVIIVRDALQSNSMHLKITANAALSADATFTIDVYGYKIPELYNTTHSIGEARHANRLLKVLRNDVANDVWYDLGNTTNPDYNKRAAIQPFVLATDYVYFGMEEIWNGLWFHVNSPNTTDAVTETWEYWDGAAWQALTVRDNCTTMGIVSNIFHYSGVIEWDTPSDWQPDTIDIAQVTTEPPYDYPGTYASKWVPRYWVRCNIDDISTSPTFYWIREKASVM